MSDWTSIKVGDHVEVPSIQCSQGVVERITPYKTAVIRLDGLGGTLSATLRELRVIGSD